VNGARNTLRAWGPLLACLAWLALTIWVRPLALPDEGRYSGVAWEMVRTGQWLTPTLDGLPYFHKPPLFYWITAASLSVFGLHEWAARLAPFLGAALAAASLFLFARRWFGEGVARTSLLVFATAPLSYFGAQYANLDMLVAGCITATIFSAAHAVLAPEGAGRNGAVLGAWLFAALGVLAKGLIGAVLPFLVLVGWLALVRRPRGLLVLLSWRGALVFLAVAGPWFVLMQERFPAFLHYFFIVQHFQRFTGTGFNNAHAFWFYPVVLALLLLPWTPWVAGLARRDFWRADGLLAQRLLLGVWVLAITLFFSLPRSKLVGYIFPVAAPLALLMADAALQRLRRSPATGRWLRGTALLAGAIGLVACVWITLAADTRQRDLALELRQQMQPGDRVVFIWDYHFAVSFYAALREPVIVVDDWTPAVVQSRDNWRKELGDAAQFQPDQRELFTAGQLDALACGTPRPRLWVFAGSEAPRVFAWLRASTRVDEKNGLTLWRLDPGAATPACPGTPSASSGARS